MDEEKRGYSTGEWSGLPQYACLGCAFDTLNLDDMLEHLVLQHSPVSQLQEPQTNQPAEAKDEQDFYEISLEEVDDGKNNPDENAG